MRISDWSSDVCSSDLLRDLAVQGANDSNNTDARANIKTEADSLVSELDRIGKSTNFNGTKLLDGSTTTLNFQVGADGDENSQISVNLSGANVKAISQTLSGGDLTTTGTSFAIADVAAVGGAMSSTTTNGDRKSPRLN